MRLGEEVLEQLRQINERLSARSDLVLTRRQAADQLKISVRQLQRLAAGGRIALHPNGVARAELERYASTLKLNEFDENGVRRFVQPVLTHPQAMRANKAEAERTRAALKIRRPR
jgi:hypothetical protein